MRTIAERYSSMLGSAVINARPIVPFFSSVTGNVITESESLSSLYWIENLVSPVLFSTAVKQVLQNIGSRKLFLEVGPHSALAGPLRQIFRHGGSNDTYLPTLVRGKHAQSDILRAFGELWLCNMDVDLSKITGSGRFLTDLPLYSWHYEGPLWNESRLSSEWRFRKHPHHDLLGSRVIESTDTEPSWRNIVRLDTVPWIREHEVAGDIVYPGVSYICMVAEAIRQLVGTDDFTVRKVHIKSALVLHEGKEAELITSMRKSNLTASLESEWYDFSISSHNGNAWVKHAFGQIRGGHEFPKSSERIDCLPRRVSSRSWYRAMKRFGMEYGPRFFGMNNISAHPSQKVGVATVANDIRDGESRYAIHPVTLDCIIQIFTVANYHGLPRNFKCTSVPTYIDELYIKPPKSDIIMRATADHLPKGWISGNLVAISDGEVVIDMTGMSMSRIGEIADATGEDRHAAVELEWKQDITFMDASTVIQTGGYNEDLADLLEKFAVACMIETYDMIEGLDSPENHLSCYRSWLQHTVAIMKDGQYSRTPNAALLANLDGTLRRILIEGLYSQLSNTDVAVVAEAIQIILTSCAKLFVREVFPKNIIGDGVIARLRDATQTFDFTKLLDLLGHLKPNMKILEVEAGTGATTNSILPLLKSAYGERTYFSYTYTDLSSEYFEDAQKRFKDFEMIDYSVLDVSLDIPSQGFKTGAYDLIIVGNSFRKLSCSANMLSNIRTLLHPQGRLLLQEFDSGSTWINFVMGILPEWWIDTRSDDCRAAPLSNDKEILQARLEHAGFTATGTVLYDGYIQNAIIAQPSPPQQPSKHITVLANSPHGSLVKAVLERFYSQGYTVDCCAIGDVPPFEQDIISLLDLERPFLHDATPNQIKNFFSFLRNAQSCGLLWVTGASQIACGDPRYGMTAGVARTARTELMMDFGTLELEDFGDKALGIVLDVFEVFQKRLKDDFTDPTLEWAFANGSVHSSRYHWISIEQELQEKEECSHVSKVEIQKPGIINTLIWTKTSLPELQSDEVEIRVGAVGVNFKVSRFFFASVNHIYCRRQ
jgi:hypothetical protein